MNQENTSGRCESNRRRRTTAETLRKQVIMLLAVLLLIPMETVYAISGSEPDKTAERETIRAAADGKSEEALDFSDLEDIVLQDCTIRVYELRFSADSTTIDLRLFPKDNEEEAAKELAVRYGELELADEQGKTVAPDSGTACDNQPRVQLDDWEGERWACCYTISLPGLESRPVSIGIKTRQGELFRLPLEWPEA